MAAAIAASLAIALVAGQSFGAPSDGLKKPPTPQLKNFEIATLAQGFDQPTSVDWLPDGTILVTEREGRLMAVSPNGVKSKLLDISDRVATQRERGLGTVEVAHDFASAARSTSATPIWSTRPIETGRRRCASSTSSSTPTARSPTPPRPRLWCSARTRRRRARRSPTPATARPRSTPPTRPAT